MKAIRNRVLNDAFQVDQTLLTDVRSRLSVMSPGAVSSGDLVSALDRLFGTEVYGLKPLKDDRHVADLRLRHLLIRGFRKYGAPSSPSTGWYGMNATDDQSRPASVILIGENGAGKSSLFNAVEYMFTKSISEADYRGFTSVADYCRHSDNMPPEVRYFTQEGCYDLQSASAGLNVNLDSFFLSENSIQALSRSIGDAANWFPFFCECLGIGDLYRFSEGDETYTRLVETLKRSVEVPDIDRASLVAVLDKDVRQASKFLSSSSQRLVQKTIDNCREVLSSFDDIAGAGLEAIVSRVTLASALSQLKVVKTWKSAVATILAGAADDTTFDGSIFDDGPEPEERLRDALAALVTGLETYLSSERDAALRQLSDDLAGYLAAAASEASVTADDTAAVDSLLLRLKKFRIVLSARILTEVKTYINESFVSVLTNVFRENFLKGGETLSVDLKRVDSGVIGVSVMTTARGERLRHHPTKYFNTFRFRLFFIVLQAALDIHVMSVLGFRFPIVIDDVFYANDYRNKVELYKFFAVLGEAAARILGNRRLLQVIFFTHDEQLVSALARNPQRLNMGYMSFGRVMDSADAERLFTCQSQLPESGERYVNLISSMYE